MRIWKFVSSKHWGGTYVFVLFLFLAGLVFFSQFASFLEWIRDTSSCSMNTCLLLIIIDRMIHAALKQIAVVIQLFKSTDIYLCVGGNYWKFCCFQGAQLLSQESQCSEKKTCSLEYLVMRGYEETASPPP